MLQLSSLSEKYIQIRVMSHNIIPKRDSAMGSRAIPKGGIDFTANKTPLEVQNAGEGVKFYLNPAMLQQLQNAPGLTIGSITIQPIKDLVLFLGINSPRLADF